jgi:small GTP-binding protein
MTENFKIALIGDEATGKSSLFRAYTKNEFIEDYEPTICDTTDATVTIDGQSILLNVLDTSGSSQYEQLRPISYNGVDLFLITFSVINPDSFRDIGKWVREVRQHARDANIILVGTKTDLRLDQNVVSKLKRRSLSPTFQNHGESLANEIKAIKYLECSSKDKQSVHRVFEEAIRTLLSTKKPVFSFTAEEVEGCFSEHKRSISIRLIPFVFPSNREDPSD